MFIQCSVSHKVIWMNWQYTQRVKKLLRTKIVSSLLDGLHGLFLTAPRARHNDCLPDIMCICYMRVARPGVHTPWMVRQRSPKLSFRVACRPVAALKTFFSVTVYGCRLDRCVPFSDTCWQQFTPYSVCEEKTNAGSNEREEKVNRLTAYRVSQVGDALFWYIASIFTHAAPRVCTAGKTVKQHGGNVQITSVFHGTTNSMIWGRAWISVVLPCVTLLHVAEDEKFLYLL